MLTVLILIVYAIIGGVSTLAMVIGIPAVLGWKIYRNTCGMSVANMTGVFLILLVWMDGRNLSTLISKSEYNEKRPVGKKWILMVLIGIGVLVLGENQYQGSDLSYMYSHIIFIVGLFLVAAFGVALILEGLKHRKQFYHRHILQMNQCVLR